VCGHKCVVQLAHEIPDVGVVKLALSRLLCEISGRLCDARKPT
jgi:hypothetical protein